MYILLLVGGREKETLQILHRRQVYALFEFYVFGIFRNSINDLLVAVEPESVLAVVAKAQCLAKIPAARVNRQQPLQELYKRRLAHTVDTDNAEFFATGESICEIVEYDLVSKTLAHALGLENLRADTR